MFQPFLGLLLLALRTGPVLPGVGAVMGRLAGFTVRDVAAERLRAAPLKVLHGSQMTGKPPVTTCRAGRVVQSRVRVCWKPHVIPHSARVLALRESCLTCLMQRQSCRSSSAVLTSGALRECSARWRTALTYLSCVRADKPLSCRHSRMRLRSSVMARPPIMWVRVRTGSIGLLGSRPHPEEVNVHDFLTDALGRAVPYGLYDLRRNEGAVSVGASADTPEFAVTTIARWWEEHGRVVYPRAMQLLILADAGGSNGYPPACGKHHSNANSATSSGGR